MPNAASPASSNPDPHRRAPGNQLRLDLYRFLLPRVQEEDQKSGAFGYIFNWDDPAAEWDSGNPLDVWDALGIRPVIQTLFYVLETKMGEELGVIESLDDIVDPFRAPKELLPLIAASFGYDLEETLDEATQRQVVSGLITAFKTAGQSIGFEVFYRMAGFKIIKVFPLFKKAVNEDQNRYSRNQFVVTPVVAEAVGPSGGLAFTGRLAEAPAKPGTIRFTDGTVVLRDDVLPTGFLPEGLTVNLIGPNGESGTVNHTTGEFTVQLVNPAVGAVTVGYDRVDDEFGFHAARIDLELLLNPGGTATTPVEIPLVDEEVVRNILGRLEESRPVHVLLRALTLIAEIPDEFNPGATDEQACVTTLKDVRPGAPELVIPGLNFTGLLDFVPDAVDADEMTIDEVTGGLLTRRHYVFEERAALACPLDVLIIEGPPGGPFFA